MMWLQVLLGVAVATAVVAVARSRLRPETREPGALRPRRRHAPPEPDPLLTLEVQLRLTEVARELRSVADDPAVYGRAHHWRAALGAYDALLREACRMVGVPVVDAPLRADARVDDDERLRAELELSARGWSW